MKFVFRTNAKALVIPDVFVCASKLQRDVRMNDAGAFGHFGHTCDMCVCTSALNRRTQHHTMWPLSVLSILCFTLGGNCHIWYVSVDGSDNNSCLSESSPCRNLQYVLDAIAEVCVSACGGQTAANEIGTSKISTHSITNEELANSTTESSSFLGTISDSVGFGKGGTSEVNGEQPVTVSAIVPAGEMSTENNLQTIANCAKDIPHIYITSAALSVQSHQGKCAKAAAYVNYPLGYECCITSKIPVVIEGLSKRVNMKCDKTNGEEYFAAKLPQTFSLSSVVL